MYIRIAASPLRPGRLQGGRDGHLDEALAREGAAGIWIHAQMDAFQRVHVVGEIAMSLPVRPHAFQHHVALVDDLADQIFFAVCKGRIFDSSTTKHEPTSMQEMSLHGSCLSSCGALA